MKWFDHTIGRRLVFRFFFYHTIVAICIAAAFLGAFNLVIWRGLSRNGWGWRSERHVGLAFAAEAMLMEYDSPDHARRDVTALHDRLDVDMTLFTPDGRVIASGARPAARPLDPQRLAKVTKSGGADLSERVFAVGLFEEERLVAYAVVDSRSMNNPPMGQSLLAFFVALLGLGAYALLARVIARPLEGLAATTRALGNGELRARASTDRKDEIGDLARAINQMADRIEQLRRAEKELLANVSHELRTPLARIRVVVELAADGDPQRSQRYLSAIAEDLTEVEQILGDIITAARLDLGNKHAKDPYPPLRLVPAPLAPVVDGVIRRFREAHPERVVRASIEGDTTVLIDRVMFKHALSNLLDNAHNYSRTEHPIEVVLRFDGADEGGTAIVEVRDHGQGIDPADVPHVFTAFFRTDRSRARNTGGVGLGLTLARRIVEAHGGTIGLKSRPGEGTTVTITLPVRTPAPDWPDERR